MTSLTTPRGFAQEWLCDAFGFHWMLESPSGCITKWESWFLSFRYRLGFLETPFGFPRGAFWALLGYAGCFLSTLWISTKMGIRIPIFGILFELLHNTIWVFHKDTFALAGNPQSVGLQS